MRYLSYHNISTGATMWAGPFHESVVKQELELPLAVDEMLKLSKAELVSWNNEAKRGSFAIGPLVGIVCVHSFNNSAAASPFTMAEIWEERFQHPFARHAECEAA
jgi:hypothetical protein